LHVLPLGWHCTFSSARCLINAIFWLTGFGVANQHAANQTCLEALSS